MDDAFYHDDFSSASYLLSDDFYLLRLVETPDIYTVPTDIGDLFLDDDNDDSSTISLVRSERSESDNASTLPSTDSSDTDGFLADLDDDYSIYTYPFFNIDLLPLNIESIDWYIDLFEDLEEILQQNRATLDKFMEWHECVTEHQLQEELLEEVFAEEEERIRLSQLEVASTRGVRYFERQNNEGSMQSNDFFGDVETIDSKSDSGSLTESIPVSVSPSDRWFPEDWPLWLEPEKEKPRLRKARLAAWSDELAKLQIAENDNSERTSLKEQEDIPPTYDSTPTRLSSPSIQPSVHKQDPSKPSIARGIYNVAGFVLCGLPRLISKARTSKDHHSPVSERTRLLGHKLELIRYGTKKGVFL